MIKKSIIEHLGLSRTFAIAGFIAILFITSLSGYLFFQYLSTNMLKREIDISSDFIHSIGRLKSPKSSEDAAVFDPRDLQSFISSITTLPDIISARVYNLDREVIWSTQRSLLGITIADNPELESALQGQKVFRLETVEQPTKLEHEYLPEGTRQFVESYIPIWNETNQEVIGVVEMYKYPQALFDSLSQGKKLVLLVSLTGGIILFLFLFWIVSNASRIITTQRDSLKLAREQSIARNEHFLSRIGAELHDGPAQSIGFALLRLDKVFDESEYGAESPGEESRRIHAALLEALQEIRNISAGLAIPELSNLTGKEAILLAANRHRRRTLMPVETQIDDLPANLGIPIKMCIYRVVQEGLNNAFRHAPEAEVSVTAEVRQGAIIISVKDDGPGFAEAIDGNPEEDTKLGLAGLKERVESVGGRLQVQSNPDRGVKISAHIPSPK